MVTKTIRSRRYYVESKEVITCDICGNDYDSRANIKRCMVCGGDVCLGCAVQIHRNSKWWHDYSDWCCEICWKAGKEQRKTLDAAEDIFRGIVDRELGVWRHNVKRYWNPLLLDEGDDKDV